MINKKLASVIILLLLLSIAITFFSFPTVHATTLAFTTSNYDGRLDAINETYLIAQQSTWGSIHSGVLYVGQKHDALADSIYRSFVFFDTSSLPNDATIDSAYLSLCTVADVSDTDFNVTIQDGTPTYPHEPFYDSDFYYQHYSGDGGSANTSAITGIGYLFNITLSADGLDWVSLTGTTKFCLRSNNDISATAPVGNEYVRFYAVEEGATSAKLYVTYSLPASTWTVSIYSIPEINLYFWVNGTKYTAPSYISVANGDTISVTAETAKIFGGKGWLFDHWIVNGTTNYYQVYGSVSITGDTTLEAIYVEIRDLYYFYGPFDEETGYPLNENVSVTVYYNTPGYSPYSFTFNGSWVYPFSPPAQHFQFNFSDGNTREYWVDPSETVLPIYIFKGDTTEYTINFMDTTGILKTYPYITIKRYVNGTLYTVEKRKVDAFNSIIASLIMTHTYQITLGNEQVTYVFGDLTMTAQTAIQLVLKGVDFPKETLLLQKYLRIYGYRSGTGNPNTITIIYSDTKEETVSVKIEINYANFTNVYTTTLYADSFVLEWDNAVYSVDYQVTVTMTHGTYGTLTWKQYFVRGFSEPPFSLAFLGNWTFNSAFLIPALIILCVAGCFSALNAEVGAILMSITAIVLTWWGWIPIPAGLLVAAITLSILMALIYNKRRGAIYY